MDGLFNNNIRKYFFLIVSVSAMTTVMLNLNRILLLPTVKESKHDVISDLEVRAIFEEHAWNESLPQEIFNKTNDIIRKEKYTESFCQNIRVLMLVENELEAKSAILTLRTLLHYRISALIFHFIVRDIAKHILTELLETWTLPSVHYHMYSIDGLNISSALLHQRMIQCNLSSLMEILPVNLTKVVFIKNGMVFLQDVSSIWSVFTQFNKTQFMSFERRYRNRNKASQVINIALLDFEKYRKQFQLKMLFNRSISDNVFDLSCEWDLPISNYRQFYQCVKYIQRFSALLYDQAYLQGAYLQATKEQLTHILYSDGDVYRDAELFCNKSARTLPPLPKGKQDLCAEFYYSARLKRRTHLYYSGKRQTYISNNEVALMTMLTLDRFNSFDMLISHWKGPVTAVFYVTDEEVAKLETKLQRTQMYQRNNIIYHLVYKRHRTYPINYLRNIALKNTKTPYSIFIDVDLVPNTGLYTYLKNYTKHNSLNKTCLVVPAFEGRHQLSDHVRKGDKYKFPVTKKELAVLYGMNVVVNYGKYSFSKGHEATNYEKWFSSSTSYEVSYNVPFEPYCMMETAEMPLYGEILMDRMKDKMYFARELSLRRYRFKVLVDNFLIHLSHSKSDSSYYVKHEHKYYYSCKARITSIYQKIQDQRVKQLMNKS